MNKLYLLLALGLSTVEGATTTSSSTTGSYAGDCLATSFDDTLGTQSLDCSDSCLSDWQSANADYSVEVEEDDPYYYSCFHDNYGAVDSYKAGLCNAIAPLCN